MVRGIDKFREFFTGYEGNYVIIGGTACEMHEEIYAQTPRATKDIDIILIVEALSSDFAAKFWEFVKTAGYRQRNKGTGNGECRHEYYRFKEPGNPDFPYQIELFSRNIGVVKFPDDAHITPIPVDDDLSSLSAILMDDALEEIYFLQARQNRFVNNDCDLVNNCGKTMWMSQNFFYHAAGSEASWEPVLWEKVTAENSDDVIGCS